MLRNSDYVFNTVLKADGKETTLQYCKKAQVGVDLSVKNFRAIQTSGIILQNKSIVSRTEVMPKSAFSVDGNNFTGWNLGRGTYICELNEGCAFGQHDTGLIILRSSFNRSGCTVVSAVWDPGYTSVDGEAIHPMSIRFTVDTDKGIYIEENARIAQLLVFENESAELYHGQFQGGSYYSNIVKETSCS